MKLISIRVKDYNYKKGVFFPFSTTLLILVLLIVLFTHDLIEEFINQNSAFIVLPTLIVILMLIGLVSFP